jgi:hypothetical protein
MTGLTDEEAVAIRAMAADYLAGRRAAIGIAKFLMLLGGVAGGAKLLLVAITYGVPPTHGGH